MTWTLASMLLLAGALAAGFAWYERTRPSARVLALVATLAALAALGRVAFAPLPNVKPTTDVVLIAGYVLGGAPGFAVGAVTAIASNLFFGQGPWTPWQMAAWGTVGLGGAALARVAGRDLGRAGLAVACAAAGAVYGAIMDVSVWVMWSGDHTAAKLGASFATSLPFDVAHVGGNVVFCLAFGPALVRALRRYRERLEVRWLPSPAGAAVAVALGVVVAAGAAEVPAARAAAPARTVAWLAAAQNADGGFGGAPGQASAGMYTGWAGLGLAAAGRNPLDVRRRGVDPLAWTAAHPAAMRDLGGRSRTILLLVAAGRSPRAFARRDLIAGLLAAQRRDGSFGGLVNQTSFAILALRGAGAGHRAVRRAAAWLGRQASPGGGYSFAGPAGPPGIDDTAAALQGLAAAGRGRTAAARRAVAWLLRRQNRDGGFPLAPGGTSNGQSTAFAVQALVAVGREPARVRRRGAARDPLAYLRRLVLPSGAVAYSRTARQTPVWVTAQALLAFARRPFPVPAVRRAAPASATGARPRPAATPEATPVPTASAPAAAPSPRAAPPAAPPAVPLPDLGPLARLAGFLLAQLI